MRTIQPSPREFRRALSKWKAVRVKEWNLGYNQETGVSVRAGIIYE